MHSLPDATRTRTMTTEPRVSSPVEGAFQPNVSLHLADLDRVVLAGAVPTIAVAALR